MATQKQRTSFISVLLFAVATLVVGCSHSDPPAKGFGAARQNNQFALDLYARLAKERENVIFSPISIDVGLSMAYAGARQQTASEIAEALHFSLHETNLCAAFGGLLKDLKNAEKSGGQLKIANSIWIQKGYSVSDSFGRILEEQYRANLNNLDLTGWPGAFDPLKAAGARKKINSWVEDETRGKINKILSPDLPDANTRCVLANAIYIKAFWAAPFDKEQTRNSRFYITAGQSVEVPMMHKLGKFKYWENRADLEMLEMPYRSERISMVILLPRAKDGLAALEKVLTVQLINQSTAAIPLDVKVSLPRFQETSQLDLKAPLADMGVREAFSPTTADFSGITAEKPFFIEAVLHAAIIDVDEEGTEAAATEASAQDTISMPVNFVADHPFLFFIRDNKTGAILFFGRVTNPLQQS